MKIGVIGAGMVGGTLIKWLKKHTKHEVKILDHIKGFEDDLSDCKAIFIAIPVNATSQGQDIRSLTRVVNMAKKYTEFVFIRSTVLPKTNDSLGTISMPEFLTARHAYRDMCKLPIVSGYGEFDKKIILKLLKSIFPKKEIILVSNTEAELAKYTHNVFGAVKVTYFNMIKKISDLYELNFEEVKKAANITGYLGKEHMQVPGHDGHLGYGGTCFPENMMSFKGLLFLYNRVKRDPFKFMKEYEFIRSVTAMNRSYRGNNK